MTGKEGETVFEGSKEPTTVPVAQDKPASKLAALDIQLAVIARQVKEQNLVPKDVADLVSKLVDMKLPDSEKGKLSSNDFLEVAEMASEGLAFLKLQGEKLPDNLYEAFEAAYLAKKGGKEVINTLSPGQKKVLTVLSLGALAGHIATFPVSGPLSTYLSVEIPALALTVAAGPGAVYALICSYLGGPAAGTSDLTTLIAGAIAKTPKALELLKSAAEIAKVPLKTIKDTVVSKVGEAATPLMIKDEAEGDVSAEDIIAAKQQLGIGPSGPDEKRAGLKR